LTPSSGKELEYVAENLVMDKVASNRMVLNQLDAASTRDIRTVFEFPDAFLEELLVLLLSSRDHIEWSLIN
jgi:hypothetical protein